MTARSGRRPPAGSPDRRAGAAEPRPARPRSCYEQAVVLLGQRAHFERELELKLARRGFTPDQVGAALERLRREGHLDDRRTAEEWLRVRRRRGDGPRRLAAGLFRKGVDRTAIEELVARAEDGAEPAAARQVAERWLARQAGRPGAVDPAALARHLDRRGFGRRAILSVLDELQLPARELSLDEHGAG